MLLQVLKNGQQVEVDQVDNVFCPTGQGGGVDPTCGHGGKGKSSGGGGSRGKEETGKKSSPGNLKNDDLVKKMISSGQKGSEIADYASSQHGFTESHWEQVIKHAGFSSSDPKVKKKLVDKIDKLQYQYSPEGRNAAKAAKISAAEKRAKTKALQAAALAKFKKRRR